MVVGKWYRDSYIVTGLNRGGMVREPQGGRGGANGILSAIRSGTRAQRDRIGMEALHAVNLDLHLDRVS